MVSVLDRVNAIDRAIKAKLRQKARPAKKPVDARPRLKPDETLLGQIFAYHGGDRARQRQIRGEVQRGRLPIGRVPR